MSNKRKSQPPSLPPEVARAMRTETNTTQGDAARAVGITQAHLSMIETGKRKAGPALAARLRSLYEKAGKSGPSEPQDVFDVALVVMTKKIGDIMEGLEAFPQTEAVTAARQQAWSLMWAIAAIGREKYEAPKGPRN